MSVVRSIGSLVPLTPKLLYGNGDEIIQLAKTEEGALRADSLLLGNSNGPYIAWTALPQPVSESGCASLRLRLTCQANKHTKLRELDPMKMQSYYVRRVLDAATLQLWMWAAELI